VPVAGSFALLKSFSQILDGPQRSEKGRQTIPVSSDHGPHPSFTGSLSSSFVAVL
jgi:hypothetical protein